MHHGKKENLVPGVVLPSVMGTQRDCLLCVGRYGVRETGTAGWV